MKPKINFLFAEQTFGSHMFVCTFTLPGQNLDADLSENRTGFGLQNLPIGASSSLSRFFSCWYKFFSTRCTPFTEQHDESFLKQNERAVGRPPSQWLFHYIIVSVMPLTCRVPIQ